MRSNARFRASPSRSPSRNEPVASASESSLSRRARCTSPASCFAALELASSSWARSSRWPEGSVNTVAKVSGAALAHASSNASLRPNRIGELFHSRRPCDKALTRGAGGGRVGRTGAELRAKETRVPPETPPNLLQATRKNPPNLLCAPRFPVTIYTAVKDRRVRKALLALVLLGCPTG